MEMKIALFLCTISKEEFYMFSIRLISGIVYTEAAE
jgi:hypothetical protein